MKEGDLFWYVDIESSYGDLFYLAASGFNKKEEMILLSIFHVDEFCCFFLSL